jgi:hypothetical protein
LAQALQPCQPLTTAFELGLQPAPLAQQGLAPLFNREARQLLLLRLAQEPAGQSLRMAAAIQPLPIHPHGLAGMEGQQHQVAPMGEVELGAAATGAAMNQLGLALVIGLDVQLGSLDPKHLAQKDPQPSAGQAMAPTILGLAHGP